MKLIPVFEYKNLLFFEEEIVKADGLVQLTVWLPATHEELEYVKKECDRIHTDPTRKCIPVYKGGRIALFVDGIS